MLQFPFLDHEAVQGIFVDIKAVPEIAASGLNDEPHTVAGRRRAHLLQVARSHPAEQQPGFQIRPAQIHKDRPGILFTHGRRVLDLGSCDVHRSGSFIDPYIHTCCCSHRSFFTTPAAGDHQHEKQCKQQRFLFHIAPLSESTQKRFLHRNYTSSEQIIENMIKRGNCKKSLDTVRHYTTAQNR